MRQHGELRALIIEPAAGAIRATLRTLMAPGIELLYVDDDIVVANKPSGLLVHRGWDDDDDVAMFRVRDAVGAHVSPVHRLDRGTSRRARVRAHGRRDRGA